MGTTLIPAAHGGTAPDDDGRVRLVVPAGALAVDTTVTIVAETIAWPGSGRVLGGWRLVAHPAPAVLAQPATLSVAVPPGTQATDLRLLFADDAAAPESDWRSLSSTAHGNQWLDARTWYLPPSNGPPTQSSVLVCLARH